MDSTGPGMTTEGALATSSSSSGAPGTEESSPTGDNTSGENSTSTDGGSASSSSGANCDGQCVAAATGAWQGPAFIAEVVPGSRLPECPKGTSPSDVQVYSGLDAPGAVCGCECGDAVGVDCGGTTLEYHGVDATCGSPDANYGISWTGTGGTCIDGPSAGANTYWRAEPVGVIGGTCASFPTTTIGAPSWGSQTVVCEAVSDIAACGEGLCMPPASSPFSSAACVWQAGDHVCTVDGFSNKRLLYAGFDDSRGCTACSCGDPAGECEGRLWLRAAAGCEGSVETIFTDGGCYASDLAVESAILPNSAAGCGGSCQTVVSAACEPQGGEPSGTIVPSEPHTFCCTD